MDDVAFHPEGEKAAFRSRLRAARAARSSEELAAAEAGLARHGVAAWRAARGVAAYASVRDEPPTRALLDGLTSQGVFVLLPCVDGDALEWGVYEGWDSLVESERGLLEPRGARRGTAEAMRDVAVAAVPALAVDRRGNRLGRGAGFYDRALADTRPAAIVAVVFAEELLDNLPVVEHDVPVHAVLTPDGLTAFVLD